MKRLRTGDQVEVICGRDKGRRGRITAMMGKDRAMVDGINMVKRHSKPNPSLDHTGGIINKVKSIHVSNLMLINPKTDQTERVKIRMLSSESESVNKRERYFKSNESNDESNKSNEPNETTSNKEVGA